jgi:hypothetical protein
MYWKKCYDIKKYEEMINLGEFGYCKYMARFFGFYNEDKNWYNYNTFDEDYSLNSYLESMTGKLMLQKPDRKELIEKINLRGDGHLRKNREMLNKELSERNMPFMITEKDIRVNGKRYKYTWVIEKIS